MPPPTRWPVAVLGLGLALSVLGATAAAQLPDILSAQERARLTRGELVVRKTEERRGNQHLMGGQSWQVVDLPPAAVWRAIRDVGRYQHMLPGVRRSRVVERSANANTIYLEHRQGLIQAGYFIEVRFADEQRVAMFQLDTSRPHDIDAGWGFFRVQPYGANRSILSFGVQMDLGSGIMIGALRPSLHEWLLKVPFTVQEYVEGDGRRYYVQARRP